MTGKNAPVDPKVIEKQITARIARHLNNPVFIALGERLNALREKYPDIQQAAWTSCASCWNSPATPSQPRRPSATSASTTDARRRSAQHRGVVLALAGFPPASRAASPVARSRRTVDTERCVTRELPRRWIVTWPAVHCDERVPAVDASRPVRCLKRCQPCCGFG